MISNPLLDTEEFQKLSSDSKAVILDASRPKPGQKDYERDQFIPGSRIFDYSQDFAAPNAPYPNTVPSSTYFEEKAQKLGINNDSILLIYDCHGIFSAPRAWFMFCAMGHKNVYVLNGGLPAWIDAGKPTSSYVDNNWDTGNFTSSTQNHAFVNLQDVVTNKIHTVVDARSSGRFKGIVKEPRPGVRSGHIPNSINLPYTDILNSDGKLKSKEALAVYFENIPEDIYYSCGSGVTACVLALGASVLGRENLKVYDGSWTEYGSSDYPISVGEAD